MIESRSSPEDAVDREFSLLSRTYSAARARREARRARQVVNWLRPVASDRVLDAACGAGTFGHAFAGRVRSVLGVDLCREMIARGSVLGASRFVPSFAVCNVARLPFRARSFDLVACSYAFANFPDPLGVMYEFARVLRPEGRIAIVEVIAPPEEARRDYLNRLEGLRGLLPTKILAADEFRMFFRKAGLVVIAARLLRRRCTCSEWLRQSPAAREPRRARVLRKLLADSIPGDLAGLSPRRVAGDLVFFHQTAWFLLRKQGRVASADAS
jgi:ubiquinone/menaquinone biosynthesis C-methylase UbiE